MARTLATKTARIHLRLDAAAKQKLERAAAYSRQSVSNFVLSHALQIAEHVIATHEPIVLSDQDRDVFFEAILNPPQPNQALRNALKWYDALNP
ncbi:MAG: DUF1778 domain-containing protein [Candidatus Competibacteraceae bacterium]